MNTLRRTLWVALLMAGPALAGTPLGWRHDGTGHFPGTSPPTSWTAANATWTTDLPGPGNASPVPLGDLVCVTAEPDLVLCADQATGRIRWQHHTPVVDTFPAAEAARLREVVAAAERAQAELSEVQRSYSLLRRELRADPGLLPRLEEAAARMGTLRQTLDAGAPYRTVGGDLVIGWASPTPATDGSALYTLFASGVVSRFQPDGTRAWTRWLGPHTRQLSGYLGQPTASPLRISDVLVVCFEDLVGLDAATGAERWRVERYSDYGTPAHLRLGDTDLVLTPDGRAVRVRDGKVLATGLGDLWYAGPVVTGDIAVWMGTTSEEGKGSSWPTRALAQRLSLSGDTLTATKLWDVQLPTRERFYASPLAHDGKLVTVSVKGTLVVLDARTGAQLHQGVVRPPVSSEAWVSPWVAGDRVWLMFDQGHVLPLDASWGAGSVSHLEPGLATPLFVGDHVFVRGRQHLFRIGKAPR